MPRPSRAVGPSGPRRRSTAPRTRRRWTCPRSARTSIAATACAGRCSACAARPTRFRGFLAPRIVTTLVVHRHRHRGWVADRLRCRRPNCCGWCPTRRQRSAGSSIPRAGRSSGRTDPRSSVRNGSPSTVAASATPMRRASRHGARPRSSRACATTSGSCARRTATSASRRPPATTSARRPSGCSTTST